MKLFDKIGPLCIVLALIVAAVAFPFPSIEREKIEEPAPLPKVETLYDKCVSGTIVPAARLRAHAIVESDERDDAIGDGGKSLSRFQLYEVYHDYRAAKWGAYNVNDPEQAGRIAALYIQETINAFPGDPDMQITAYCFGIEGARRHGVDMVYVARVKSAL